MDKTKAYFLDLLGSFLHRQSPEEKQDIDWQCVFDLSVKHDVTGIIAHQINLLPKSAKPTADLQLNFRKVLAQSLYDYDKKQATMADSNQVLSNSNIEHAYIKGSLIGKNYPVPELRTQGDTDIYVKAADYLKAIDALKDAGYVEKSKGNDVCFFVKNNDNVELHSNADVGYSFFDDLFSLCYNHNKLTFFLKQEYQLLFALCHFVKHLRCYGAGIRMLMDIDAIISSNPFDEKEFFNLCRQAGCEETAMAVLSLCHQWLKTPIKQYVNFDTPNGKRTLELFECLTIDFGNFGVDNASVGSIYLDDTVKRGEKATFKTSFFALMKFVFPSPNVLMQKYDYARKHPFLVPISWFNRVFDGIFKRGSNSAKTAVEIFTRRDETNLQNELLTYINAK